TVWPNGTRASTCRWSGAGADRPYTARTMSDSPDSPDLPASPGAAPGPDVTGAREGGSASGCGVSGDRSRNRSGGGSRGGRGSSGQGGGQGGGQDGRRRSG